MVVSETIFFTFSAFVVESILAVDLKDKFNFTWLLCVFVAAKVKAATADALCGRVSEARVELKTLAHDLPQILKLLVQALIQVLLWIDIHLQGLDVISDVVPC